MTDRRHRAFQQYAGDPEKYQLSSACKNAETKMDSSYFFLMDKLMSIKWVIRSDDVSAGILELILDRSLNNNNDVQDFKTYELDSNTTMMEPIKDASLVPAADTDQMVVADTNQPDDAKAADLHITPAAAAEATVSDSTLVVAADAGTPADLATSAAGDGQPVDPDDTASDYGEAADPDSTAAADGKPVGTDDTASGCGEAADPDSTAGADGKPVGTDDTASGYGEAADPNSTAGADGKPVGTDDTASGFGKTADSNSTAAADGKRADAATTVPSAGKLAWQALFWLLIFKTFQSGLCSEGKLLVSDQCLSFLRKSHYSTDSCPNLKAMTREKVSLLNSKCCHPGELFHCQEEDGTNILELAGCIKGQDVPPGHYSRLVNIGDALQLQIHPCAKDSFEDNFRNSSSLVHPFCTRSKSSCTGIGEEKHCFGGTTQDDLCRCKTGFKPSSPDCLTFNDTSMCTCDAGTAQMPLANIVGNCSIANHLSESNCSCVPSASTKPPIPTGSTSHESSFGPHENSTSSTTSHPPALTSSNLNFVAVFVPLGILILIVILLVVAWQYRNVLLNSFGESFLARVRQCMGRRLNTNGSQQQHETYIYDPVNQNVVGV